MSNVISRSRCPSCASSGGDTSGNNLIHYSDGGTYCFACGHKEGDRKVSSGLVDGIHKDLPSRGISKKVCTFFNYTVGHYTGVLGGVHVTDSTVHVANYLDSTGNTVAQKIRGAGKKMSVLGDGKSLSLYGKWLWEPNPKLFVTIVEGEIDCLSVAEAQGTQFPVVSVSRGAKAAAKDIAASLEWLSGFKYVVLMFDNDDAGKHATEECVELFEPGKVRVAQLPLKDANDMLVAGRGSELTRILLNAKPYRPDSIISVDDIIERAATEPVNGLSWPWESLTKCTYGILPNYLYTIGGGSGSGKTEFVKEIVAHLCLHHKERVGIFSFEQDPEENLKRVAGTVLNKRIYLPDHGATKEEVLDSMLQFGPYLRFYDHRGMNTFDNLVGKIRFMCKAEQCRYLIIDPLTAIISSVSDKEERLAIDKIMSTLIKLVHELRCTIFLVAHLSKPGRETNSYEEGGQVRPSAFRGSQSIQYWSKSMFSVERNRFDDNRSDRNAVRIRILKDRFSGNPDGEVIRLRYNQETGRLLEDSIQENTDGFDIMCDYHA